MSTPIAPLTLGGGGGAAPPPPPGGPGGGRARKPKKKKTLGIRPGGGGSKKQQPSSYQADAFGYVDTSTLTDRQFERLLAQYEEDGARKREQKKQRIERGYADDDYPYVPPPEGDRPAFDDLPKEAIQRVFEFLPTVRAVFNLAYQSKYMMSFVEERVSSGVGGGDLLLRMYEAGFNSVVVQFYCASVGLYYRQ